MGCQVDDEIRFHLMLNCARVASRCHQPRVKFGVGIGEVRDKGAIEPNQAVVLSLFGKYVGTARETGLRFTNPFYAVKKISLRIRNFETSKLKVNELEGSPIEIGAVIVWQVVDSAEAVYNVDDYESYVHIQAESALRQMATSYPYDNHDDPNTMRLRAATTALACWRCSIAWAISCA